MSRSARRVPTAMLALLLLVAACTGADEPERNGTEPTEEAVAIAASGLELAGTLRLPAGPGAHPGVVVVHGSGPQSRRGLSPGQLGLTLPQQVPVYEELAEGLRRGGYAVLTFDKRSCGPFNGCADNGYPEPPDDLTFDTFVEDAQAALDHLAAREDVADLSVLGHSQGGTIAAQLAGERADLAAVALVATPAVPIADVLAEQAETLERLVRAAGQSGAGADRAVAELRTVADEVAAIAAGRVDGGAVGGASRAFWSSWIDASVAAPDQVRDASSPVFVLGGTTDWNVPPALVDAWEPSLGPDDTLVILPGITHALMRLDVEDPAAITPADVGTRVDPEVVTTVVDWLDRHRRPPTADRPRPTR